MQKRSVKKKQRPAQHQNRMPGLEWKMKPRPAFFDPFSPSSQKLKIWFEFPAARKMGCVPAGTTNNVILCAGSVLLRLLPVNEISLRCEMLPAEVNRHNCATPLE